MMKNNLRLLSAVIAAWMLVVSAQACGSGGPKPINYGKDQCAHCRMTVSDARFGSQLVTKKGRAFHFDDVQCLVAYVEGGTVAGGEVAGYYLPDYAGEHRLLPAEGLFLLKSESLKSPMRGDVAAFESEEELETVREIHGGERLVWKDLWKQ